MATSIFQGDVSVNSRAIVAGPMVEFTIIDDAAFPANRMSFYVDGSTTTELPGTVGATPVLHPTATQRADGKWEARATADLRAANPVQGSTRPLRVRARVRSSAVDKSCSTAFWLKPNEAALPQFSSVVDSVERRVVLNASGSVDSDGTIVDYAWDFGDGSTGSGLALAHAYAHTGQYDVTLVVTDDDGATASVTNPIVITGYVSPAPLGPDGTPKTCRIPRDKLVRVTSTAAGAMGLGPNGERPSWSGLLITGAVLTPAVGVTGTDCVIEANGRTDALLKKRQGGGRVQLSHFSVSGLQRDDDGEPLALHAVNRLIQDGTMELDSYESSWGNDTWGIGSNGKSTNCYHHSHTLFIKDGEEQHRDSVQMQQGGGQSIKGGEHHCNTDPVPTRRDGAPVPAATEPRPCSSTFMINHDQPITGLVEYSGNRTWGGSSVVLNVSGGVDPGETLDWWVPRYDANGVQVRGLLVENNIIEELPRDGFVIRAPKAWLRTHFGATWYDTPVSDGCFLLRKADGTLTNKFSDIALIGT